MYESIGQLYHEDEGEFNVSVSCSAIVVSKSDLKQKEMISEANYEKDAEREISGFQ